MKLTQLFKALMVSAPLILAGCSSTSDTYTDVESSGVVDAGMGGDGSYTDGSSANGVSVGSASQILTPEEQQRQYEEQIRQSTYIIYFDFDRSDIQGEYLEVIQAHGNYLLEDPQRKVLIEGHADERGTPEYNIALGERRAKAVAKYLHSMGVMPSQISYVSYGEEKPLDFTRTDSGFAKNRRAVLVY